MSIQEKESKNQGMQTARGKGERRTQDGSWAPGREGGSAARIEGSRRLLKCLTHLDTPRGDRDNIQIFVASVH